MRLQSIVSVWIQVTVARCMYYKLVREYTQPHKTWLGSLAVKQTCNSTWSRVCHYGDDNVANSVCKLLGFTSGVWIKWSYFASIGDYPIAWEKINCPANWPATGVKTLETFCYISNKHGVLPFSQIWPANHAMSTDLCGRGRPPADTGGVHCFGDRDPGFTFLDAENEIFDVEVESIADPQGSADYIAQFYLPLQHRQHVNTDNAEVIVLDNAPGSNCAEGNLGCSDSIYRYIDFDTETDGRIQLYVSVRDYVGKRYKVRVNVWRNDCNVEPLKYLLHIEPYLPTQPHHPPYTRVNPVHNMIYTAFNISWRDAKLDYADRFAITVRSQFPFMSEYSGSGPGVRVDEDDGSVPQPQLDGAVYVASNETSYIWTYDVYSGYEYNVHVFVLSGSAHSLASHSRYRVPPRPAANMWIENLNDTTVKITVPVPLYYEGAVDYIEIRGYIWDWYSKDFLYDYTRPYPANQVLEDQNDPQNATFIYSGFNAGMKVKFTCRMMIRGVTTPQTLYAIYVLDLLPATNFTCYWSEPRGAHYCHYKFPRTNLYAEDVKLRGCEPGVAGRCWPDIDVYVSQTLSSHQGGEIMLPFNLPVATLQFVIMAKSFTKLSPPSQPSTINISDSSRCVIPDDFSATINQPNLRERLTLRIGESFNITCDEDYEEETYIGGSFTWVCGSHHGDARWTARSVCLRRQRFGFSMGPDAINSIFLGGSAVLLSLSIISIIFVAVEVKRARRPKHSIYNHRKTTSGSLPAASALQ